MKALIVSTEFSPGHYSHMIALGKLLEKIGYKTDYYLDKKYSMMFEEELNVIYSGQETSNAYSLIFFRTQVLIITSMCLIS